MLCYTDGITAITEQYVYMCARVQRVLARSHCVYFSVCVRSIYTYLYI